ncbi:MAG: hypothetical protein SOZ56_01800 [Oscillospiraceae bacterium]|nr:hypothetical protein [Oscillospiraceae bacterium]
MVIFRKDGHFYECQRNSYEYFIEPNDETKAAIEEREAMLNDPEARRYKSVDELFEDLSA